MSRRSSESRNGKARKNGLAKYSNEWKGFVDVQLSEDDKARIAGDVEGGEIDFWKVLASWIDEGYKLSISPDTAHNCVIATITSRLDGDPNFGYSLSARGPNAEGAVAALYYKDHVILEDGLWSLAETKSNGQLSLFG